MSDLLEPLNPAQREAVTHGGGPLLVLAGAGSGKTRVIAHRIAHLILHRGVDPNRIIALTFTNKAAGEMRERVLGLLGDRSLGAWLGTFHALCLRILRRDGAGIGLAPGFNVYDTDDQLAVVRRILREEQVEDDAASARTILSSISRAKSSMEDPGEAERRAFSPERKLQARVYALYVEALRRANAVDFDDLLLETLELFRERGEVARRYAERCEHLLVDEYQDTNRPQYLLARALSAAHGNLCVVGDEDQSIYRFRGAEIRNILDFESDHPGARTIKLEQNYRSTATILGAAGAVISNNLERKGKSLWTSNPAGETIDLLGAPDDRAEAAWISRKARALRALHPWDEMVVLYRTNAQSRQIEEAFREVRIPYQVVGSVRFYERKEVKDLLAYLKLAANPLDDVSFRRIVNTPPRGIGDASVKVLDETARKLGLPLRQAAGEALSGGLLPARSARALQPLLDLTDDLSRRAAAGEAPAAILRVLIDSLDFGSYLRRAHPGEGADRMENVQALVSATTEYQEEAGEATLQGFLDRAALVSDADEVGSGRGVTLMTVHCAKGLEFAVVFLAGLEENLFPHVRSAASQEDIEEERRLCYVAMTRARERLLLSHAWRRRTLGVPLPALPSRFVAEIPERLLRRIGPGTEGLGGEDGSSPRRPDRSAAVGSSAARAAARVAEPAAAFPPAGAPRESADGFAVGAYVLHPQFGNGRILGREGSGKQLKLTIHFLGRGSKKILPAYTDLRVVAK